MARKMSSHDDVFRDLGFSPTESEELRLRSDLLIRLKEKIEAIGESQSLIAKRLKTSQPRVSDLTRGKLHLFSLEELVRMLRALGADVSLNVREASAEPAIETTTRTEIWAPLALEQQYVAFAMELNVREIERVEYADTRLRLAA